LFELEQKIREDCYNNKKKCLHPVVNWDKEYGYCIPTGSMYGALISYCPHCGIDLSKLSKEEWNKRYVSV